MPDIAIRILGLITAGLVFALALWGWRDSRRTPPVRHQASAERKTPHKGDGHHRADA